jgi:hypothetical protein
MTTLRYIYWLHDSDGLVWLWCFEYPMNVRKFGMDVQI